MAQHLTVDQTHQTLSPLLKGQLRGGQLQLQEIDLGGDYAVFFLHKEDNSELGTHETEGSTVDTKPAIHSRITFD